MKKIRKFNLESVYFSTNKEDNQVSLTVDTDKIWLDTKIKGYNITVYNDNINGYVNLINLTKIGIATKCVDKLYVNGKLDTSNTFKIKSKPGQKDVVTFVFKNVPTDLYQFHRDCKNIIEVDINNVMLDSIQSFNQTFMNCKNIKRIKFTNSSAPNVTDYTSMFQVCENVEEITFDNNFSTSKGKEFNAMFNSCSKITNLDLSMFDFSSATNLKSLFISCKKLNYIDLSGEKCFIPKGAYCDAMFIAVNPDGGILKINQLNKESWISKLHSLGLPKTWKIFDEKGKLIHPIESTINVSCIGNENKEVFLFNDDTNTLSLVNDMYIDGVKQNNFTNKNTFNDNKEHYVSYFLKSNLIKMSGLCSDCQYLTSVYVSNLNTSNIKDMSFIFSNCKKLKSIELDIVNTFYNTTLSEAFLNCESLETINLSNIDIRNLVFSENMFNGCNVLSEIDLSGTNCNPIKLTNFNNMFGGLSKSINGTIYLNKSFKNNWDKILNTKDVNLNVNLPQNWNIIYK